MKQNTENLVIALIIAFALFDLAVAFAAFGYTVIDNNHIATSTRAAFNTQVAIESEEGEETAYPPTLQAILKEVSTEGQPTSIIPTPSISSQDWLTMWLSKPTCQPPCWENITPGETSLSDAVRRIAQIPGTRLSDLELTPHPVTQDIYIQWDFVKFGDGAMISNNGDIIIQVDLHPNDENEPTIDEIIKAFGEPSSVVREDCFGEWFNPVRCGYSLDFKRIGVFLGLVQSTNMDQPVNIHPGDQVASITFFQPLRDPESSMNPLAYGNYDMDEIKWDGYRVYDFNNK